MLKSVLCSYGYSCVLILAVFVVLCCGCERPEGDELSERIIGVKIYKHDGNFNDLFREFRTLGINTVFCSVELYSKPEFGKLARQHGISAFIILPIFFDADTLEQNPNLFAITSRGQQARHDWVTFVCPSRQSYREQKIRNIVDLVKVLEPDGISIDFIRHFVYWEMVSPKTAFKDLPQTCFDSNCLQRFQNETGIIIPASLKSESEIAAWLLAEKSESWTNWRCDLISSMVADIVSSINAIKPGIRVNSHIIPWRQTDFDNAIIKVAGQDIEAFTQHVDYLSPMTYSHMVRQTPAWIHSVVEDMYKTTGHKILPSIQVNRYYLSDSFTVRQFKEALQNALLPPSTGVVLWSWEQLVDSPAKVRVVRELCGG